jgi:uncharacterized protein (TIGR02271 family)
MRTVEAGFRHDHEAQAARAALIAEGIEPQRVSILNRNDAQPMPFSAEMAKGRGLWANIKDIVSAPDESHSRGATHLEQGGYVLTVSVPEERLEGVIALLSKTGVVTFDTDDTDSVAGASDNMGSKVHVPVVEEHLVVHARSMDRGDVRLSSQVNEEPVHQRVQLYDYRVRIERRAVERGAGADSRDGLADLFRERVIEMTETTDEVSFAKEARVREEVVVRKEVHERVESIDTTLRRTNVSVQRTDYQEDTRHER